MNKKKAIFIGFLFGILILPILGGLALVHPVFELIAYPFVIPTKFLAQIFSLGRFGSLVGVLVAGLFYATVGWIVWFLFADLKKSKE